ncbi:hypothetical protein FB45DRAFT_939485 [Roridomyces roridus]|uniref:BTB domain-containing protein n=1 Tax=Roridomyces roridus TaxID=1738132 RepID=A0AAD7B735_9AGAR|nr:hypothetical protein FB45DRAFT_939485 [Roridomyces roridus]
MYLTRTAEEWTSTGVKSTFTIHILWDSDNPDAGPLVAQTESCGLGWRFFCLVKSEESYPDPLGNLKMRSATATLSFDPGLLRGTNFGRLTFHTDLDNAVSLPDELFYSEFDCTTHLTEPLPIAVFKCNRTDNDIPRISISVDLDASLGINLPKPLNPRVEMALADTIRGHEVVDVKFYAYTRAAHSGSYVARPKSMCARMDVLLGHSDVLDAYLEGIAQEGFTESYLVDLDAYELAESQERFEEYDYMSDSDLDTDDEEEEQEKEQRPTKLPVASTSTLPVARRMGRVVVVKGHAYKTWNALLYYLYTRKVVFRILHSEQPPSSRIPECSVKSMYKLADAFGLTELKALALASFKSQLNPENILEETFSRFTSWYEEVQDVAIPILMQHLPNMKDGMKRILRGVCNGTRPYALDVLQKVVCREGIPMQPAPPLIPFSRASPVSRSVSPTRSWYRPHRRPPVTPVVRRHSRSRSRSPVYVPHSHAPIVIAPPPLPPALPPSMPPVVYVPQRSRSRSPRAVASPSRGMGARAPVIVQAGWCGTREAPSRSRSRSRPSHFIAPLPRARARAISPPRSRSRSRSGSYGRRSPVVISPSPPARRYSRSRSSYGQPQVIISPQPPPPPVVDMIPRSPPTSQGELASPATGFRQRNPSAVEVDSSPTARTRSLPRSGWGWGPPLRNQHSPPSRTGIAVVSHTTSTNMGRSRSRITPAPAPAGDMPGLESMQNVATEGWELFRGDGNITFERDFGQWFNPDDVGSLDLGRQ